MVRINIVRCDRCRKTLIMDGVRYDIPHPMEVKLLTEFSQRREFELCTECYKLFENSGGLLDKFLNGDI